jgi:hypothetical protein
MEQFHNWGSNLPIENSFKSSPYKNSKKEMLDKLLDRDEDLHIYQPITNNEPVNENCITTTTKHKPPYYLFNKNNFKTFMSKDIFKNPLLIVLLVFIITILVLLIINPPFIRKQTDNRIQKSPISIFKIIILSLIASILTILIPILYLCIKKKK